MTASPSAALTDQEAIALLYDWERWARSEQLPPPGKWRIWLLLAGRGFGKTRVGAEWTRKQAKVLQHVNLIGPSAADVRDVMIEGESGILAICPPHERPEYFPSRRLLRWPSGAKTLCFSAEDPEQLRGPQHQALWTDELAAWSNHTRQETWDLAMLGLRLGPDPRAVATTTPKPVPLLRSLIEDETVVVTKGSTYDNRQNLAEEFFTQLIKRFEGTRLGRQELDAELLLDEGLAYRIVDGVHVVQPFDVHPSWERTEGFDHGKTHAACWHQWASDYEGNQVAHLCYYSPGEVSEHASAIHALRRRHGEGPCYADPSIRNKLGNRDLQGREISVELEYNDRGLYFNPGQNDRRAGYIRLSELLKLDPDRSFPAWHPLAGQKGAPRLFIMDKPELEPLIQQFRDAPLEDPDSPMSKFPGEAVEADWEGRPGHAHAAARYLAMGRPGASQVPTGYSDPRKRALRNLWRRGGGKREYAWG